MIITDTLWYRVRARFTEEEKAQLRSAAVGQTICPPGVVIDESSVSSELLSRLQDAKAGRA